jgi:hypothetical protein
MSDGERLLLAVLGNSADGKTTTVAEVQTGGPLIHLSPAGQAALKSFGQSNS